LAGPQQFSARFALGWNDSQLYLGFDLSDSALNQPFRGRDITKGDTVSIILETAFRKNFRSTDTDGDEYHIFFSPGDFGSVMPSVYSAEDYLPPRPVARDTSNDIKAAWKKTPKGFSGDIAIPVSWFEGGVFKEGYEIGLSVSAEKAFPPPPGLPEDSENIQRIVFHSKQDRLFPVRFGNPSSYQRLVLSAERGCH
jgi:hypothetical protein